MTRYALDCAFTFIDPVAAKKVGYEGMIRYLAIDGPQTHPKLWTPSRITACHDAGMWTGAVFEQNAEDPNKGEALGKRHIQVAEQEWSSLGAPSGTVVGVAYDFDANPDTVRPYGEGVRAASSGEFPIMAYCSDAVAVKFFQWGLIDYFWQTESSGFGGTWPSPRAHIIQHTWYDLRPKLDGDYDENVLHPEVGEVPWWYPPGQGGFLMALTDKQQQQMFDNSVRNDNYIKTLDQIARQLGYTSFQDALLHTIPKNQTPQQPPATP